MSRLFTVIALLAIVACDDSSGPDIVFLIAGNSPAAPTATVIVTRDSDTLYNTTFPPGAHSCGFIPVGAPVDVIVQRADTTAVFPSVSLSKSALVVQSLPASVTVAPSAEDCY